MGETSNNFLMDRRFASPCCCSLAFSWSMAGYNYTILKPVDKVRRLAMCNAQLILATLVLTTQDVPAPFVSTRQASGRPNARVPAIAASEPVPGEHHHLHPACQFCMIEASPNTHTEGGTKCPDGEQSCSDEKETQNHPTRQQKSTGVVHQVATESHRKPP